MNQSKLYRVIPVCLFIIAVFIVGCNGDDKPTPPPTVEPELTVSPDSLVYSPVETSHTISIANTGTGSLSWEAQIDSTWLMLDSDSGTITTTPVTITATIDRDSIALGYSDATIQFTSNGGTVDIDVSVDNTVLFGADYFPFAAGDIWYYTNDSGQSIVRTVEGDTTICTHVCTRIYHNGEIAEAWSIDDTTFNVHLLTGAISVEVFPFLKIPFNLPSVDPYHFNSLVLVDCTGQGFYIEGDLEFLDYTTRTVPAGTFGSVIDLYYDPIGDDPEDPPYHEYYAPGVGLLDNEDLVLDSAYIGGVWHRP